MSTPQTREYQSCPQPPSNAELAAELGLAPGSAGWRAEVARRKESTEAWRRYVAALAAWESSPAVAARRAERERATEAARAESERLRAEQAARDEAVRAAWLRLPGPAGRETMGLLVVQVETLAHLAAAAGGLKVFASDRSETRYVAVGSLELRISGHELGVADYGARVQRHRGPEVVLAGATMPAEALAEAILSTLDCARGRDAIARRWAAKMVRGLRAVLKLVEGGAA